MTRTLHDEVGPASLQCDDCRTLAQADEPYCGACGGNLGPRKKSRVAYDALATFIGLGAAILYWIVRTYHAS